MINWIFTILICLVLSAVQAGNSQKQRCLQASKSVPNLCSYTKAAELCKELCKTLTNDDLKCGSKKAQVRSDEDEEESETSDTNRNDEDTPEKSDTSDTNRGDEDENEQRIVGGQPADKQEWPWHVSLRLVGRNDTKKNKQWCAGSIITENLILTASHCIDEFTSLNAENWEAVVGDFSLKNPDTNEKRIRVQKLIKHEQFLYEKFTNITSKEGPVPINRFDVALYVLKENIDMTNISPICLPDDSVKFKAGKDKCTVVGWGYTNFQNGSQPDELREAVIPLVSRKVCNSEEAYGGIVDKTNICGGYKEGGTDACQFDSGGAMVCSKDKNRWYANGLVSSGYKCATANGYGLYTNLPLKEIREWIVGHMLSAH